MIEFDWTYTAYCENCDKVETFYRIKQTAVKNILIRKGWRTIDRRLLCKKCAEEAEYPCEKCIWRDGREGVCVCDKSPHCADFVLPSMHCKEWKKRDESAD